MKTKQILTIVLIVFVVGSLAYMIVREQKTNSSLSEETNNAVPAAQNQNEIKNIAEVARQDSKSFTTINQDNNAIQETRLIVYYFHGHMRCPTCHKLESYAKEALETFFAEQLANKKMQWEVISIEAPENEHYIKDYQLVTRSVVLSKVADGKELAWKNLDQIWAKVGDKNSYLEYIRNSITKFLEDEH